MPLPEPHEPLPRFYVYAVVDSALLETEPPVVIFNTRQQAREWVRLYQRVEKEKGARLRIKRGRMILYGR